MEIELQAIKEVLQKVSRLQLENTQAISELTFQVSKLSRSFNTFVANHSTRSTSYKEQSNKANGMKRNKQYIPNKPTTPKNKTESKIVREQIDTMLTQFHALMTYLEEPKYE